ncbi:hypothetical protein [Novosphingobium taihuense]|uniref:Uncharacterized protein n=1 Tax=Novosphingobium taihuense TaxID=260085 RepID=A0A7W7AEJ3_9SPHN|nr:hypothetical protein [Novosphingobium taihuense]MBB4615564.1 hypothetical protein [Novosphingobium taihuense]TWH82855.1 hypothetical protein IQ25_03136 [Novosphingobium taihuense]
MKAGLYIGIAALCLGQTGQAMAQEQAAPPAAPAASAGSTCELHVFPTENYIGFNSGLLSGFGIVGAVADQEAHKGRVATVKDLMKDYLGPDIQLAELEKINYRTRLGVQDWQVIIEPPTPSNEAVKADPVLKAKIKALNADLKAGKRITSSTNPCYAEFLLVSVFYFKAMMYGSNLLVGTQFRDFSKGGAPIISIGAVKNPLEVFPPKTPDMVEPAKAELRDAFAKDFIEWTEKKLKDDKAARK